LLQLVNPNTFSTLKRTRSRWYGVMVRWGSGWVLAIFFAGIQMVAAKSTTTPWDVSWLDTLKKEAFRDSVNSLYGRLLLVHDYPTRAVMARKLFDLTARKDEIAHIQSLVYRMMLFENQDPALFEKAYSIAEKHNRIDELNFVEYSRGLYYIARKQYDSAMVHILRYRDHTPANLQLEGYRNILNLLGDIYYNARLYDQATEIYAELLAQYERENNWNHYRPYVMMNNFGQIAYNRGDYPEAAKWFTRSLSIAEAHLRESYRNNTLAYIRIKLAETALVQDSIERAAFLLHELEFYPPATIQEDVRQEFLYAKARLFFKQGDLQGAGKNARLLLPDDSLRFGEYRFIPEGYRLLSEIASKNGDCRMSCIYLQHYQQITDSMRALEHLAQSMIILADRNHEETRQALEKSRHWVYNLGLGLTFLLIILITVLVLYRKLYRSKLALVRIWMENPPGPTPEPIPQPTLQPLSGSTGPQNAENVPDQGKLVAELLQLMDTNAPYLDPKLSILELSQMLSTNRTYLSRAINQQLQTTFPNFINEYRVREAIRLIRSGFMVQHTQEALARECGFANRTVFSQVFKKHTGVTPSFFAANYQKGNKNWELS